MSENSELTTVDTLPLWTIYKHPRDYPEHFVARKWLIYPNKLMITEDVLFRPDLESLQQIMREKNLHRLERLPDDDPTIQETWL